MKVSKSLSIGLVAGLLVTLLGAWNDLSGTSVADSVLARKESVETRSGQTSIEVTGWVQRAYSDLSFQVGGRISQRLVNVGDRVRPGQVLECVDSTERQGDVIAAITAVAASEARLQITQAIFDRQRALSSQGAVTESALDRANEDLRHAEASLKAAQAQLLTAKDKLGFTALRADATGVITVRRFKVGRAVQAGQPVLSLARDSDRDAVFDVSASILSKDLDGDHVLLRLVSNPAITATGRVRKVTQMLHSNASIVRVEVAIKNPPAEMTLGSAVVGTAKSKPTTHISGHGLSSRVEWSSRPQIADIR